jgi:hypothetical protein
MEEEGNINTFFKVSKMVDLLGPHLLDSRTKPLLPSLVLLGNFQVYEQFFRLDKKAQSLN